MPRDKFMNFMGDLGELPSAGLWYADILICAVWILFGADPLSTAFGIISPPMVITYAANNYKIRQLGSMPNLREEIDRSKCGFAPVS